MGLALGQAHAQAVAFRGKRNENDKALREPGKTVSAEDHLFNGDFNDVTTLRRAGGVVR